jgi:hypothetical protein
MPSDARAQQLVDLDDHRLRNDEVSAGRHAQLGLPARSAGRPSPRTTRPHAPIRAQDPRCSVAS